jgi:hypothetical protein
MKTLMPCAEPLPSHDKRPEFHSMRDLSSPLLLSAMVFTSSLVGCSDEPAVTSPGNNTPLEDEDGPAGFDTYGFWYTYDDIESCKGTGDPNLDTEAELSPYTKDGTRFTTTPYSALGLTPFNEPLEHAPNNTHGIRFTGQGHEYFGAGLGFKLEGGYVANGNKGIDFHAAGVSGFRFWAFSSIDSSYIFKVQDLYSTPEAGLCVPRKPFPGCEDEQNCENAPSITFSLAAGQWTYVEAFFGAVSAQVTSGPAQVYGPLARQNWPGEDIEGRPMKDIPAEPKGVFQLQFQTATATQETPFDLIIDNFGFILKGGPADKTVAP